jgi:hypothetical protein
MLMDRAWDLVQNEYTKLVNTQKLVIYFRIVAIAHWFEMEKTG